MTKLFKGIIITTVSIPVVLIGMNVAGRLLEKRQNKNSDVIIIK